MLECMDINMLQCVTLIYIMYYHMVCIHFYFLYIVYIISQSEKYIYKESTTSSLTKSSFFMKF
jgi:hypothetical protein